MTFEADTTDKIKKIINEEILDKLEDGAVINHVELSDNKVAIIITETIPTLKQVVLIDFENKSIDSVMLGLPTIVSDDKKVGSIQ